MSSYKRCLSGGLVFLGAMTVSTNAGEAPSSALPSELQGKGISSFLHAYIDSGRLHPEHVLSADSNLELLFALREARTEPELRRSFGTIHESQFILLETTGLIRRVEANRWQTAIPIVAASETHELRALARRSAKAMADTLDEEIGAFVKRLTERGWQANAFGILFSLVLDGRVWDLLEDRQRVRPRELSIEQPFWSGTVWILFPDRNLSVGTNTVSDRNAAIKINWSPKAIRMMGRLLQGHGMEALLNAADGHPKPAPPETRKMFAGYGIFDADGHWQVPLIRRSDPNDRLVQDVERLSERVVATFLAHLPDSEIALLVRQADASERIVVYYHELMWELLELLAEQKSITIPEVLHGKGKKDQLGSLVLAVQD